MIVKSDIFSFTVSSWDVGIFQTCMRSYLVRVDSYIWVEPSPVSIHSMCEQKRLWLQCIGALFISAFAGYMCD